MSSLRQTLVAAIMGAVAIALAGCGGGVSTTVITPLPPNPVTGFGGAAFSGKVMAGSLPVVGASVQLYAAGTKGNGSAPTALLPNTLSTDSTGAFSVSGGFQCPSAAAVVYIVASGGRAGTSGGSNSGIVLMSSPGACSSVNVGATYVLNEVTTVGSAYAFAQFLKAGAQLGATSTNTAGLTLAAGTLGNLVNLGTGTAPGAGFPGNGAAPTARLNSLANALNACLDSSAAVSTACSNLYAAAPGSGGVSNTLDAVLSIVQHPGTNVSQVFGLAGGSTAYAPALSAAPKDWVLFAQYTGGGMNSPSDIAIDSMGRVWVGNYFGVASLFTNTGNPVFAQGVTGSGLNNSYGAAVDASDNVWIANEQSPGSVNSGLGSVTVLSSSGATLSGSSGFFQGGLNFPIAVAIDTSGVAWVGDYGNSHLTLLNSNGMPQSGSGGYSNAQLQLPVAIAVDSKRNGWLADFPANSVTEISADGTTVKAYATGAGPTGVAIDEADNVWVSNYFGSSVSLIAASGVVLSGSGYTGGGLNDPQEVAIDGAGAAWVANYRGPSLSELASVASGTAGLALSPSGGWGADANLLEAFGLAVDASGNVWVSGFGNNTLTEFIGLAAPVKTPLVGPVRVP